ncbi:PiggyBac transposable element-derived protein 4 [Plakobranchus ocellatus]|uniref:PiggyBac transposable element-derived protein 4 n=1 Tax=Plakobranchus ocellatus TaxID=259542 RepID=A0AAV4ADH6_9GAST|nr:PiggyBac transposable element-derived protein 4 [Plakobranchus ocellatus]
MASGGKSRTGPSRNLFASVQVESDAAGDQVDHDRAIDREEDDADQYNEDEFVPFNDDNDTDTTTSDSGGVESADPNLNSSISEELINGAIVRTRSYFGKDGSEWKNIPMAPNAQTTSANIVNFPQNSIPNTQNATSPAEPFDLFISQDMIKVIVKCTNEEGKRQRGDAWKVTDDVEIRGLIRFLVLLGAQKQSKVNFDYNLGTPYWARFCASHNVEE